MSGGGKMCTLPIIIFVIRGAGSIHADPKSKRHRVERGLHAPMERRNGGGGIKKTGKQGWPKTYELGRRIREEKSEKDKVRKGRKRVQKVLIY